MKVDFHRKQTTALVTRTALAAMTLAAATLATAACAGRTATVESEPAPLIEEDYYGEYDLYLGGMPITEGEPAPMTAEWTAEGFVASQDGQPTIRTAIAIYPARNEVRVWDDETEDILCASEGVYTYEDDGATITMALVFDPCTGRAESADGARLVRR
jgi:hypothetical protein